jgi:hypothetical protein
LFQHNSELGCSPFGSYDEYDSPIDPLPINWRLYHSMFFVKMCVFILHVVIIWMHSFIEIQSIYKFWLHACFTFALKDREQLNTNLTVK